MTDLENLWDDLPVGPAPTGAILREARAQSRRRRSRRGLLRPLTSIAGLAALGTAFVVGTYVASPPPDGSGPSANGPGDGSGAAEFHGELMAGESCDSLLDYYVERGLELVGPYGWDYPYYGEVLAGAMADVQVNLTGERSSARAFESYKAPAPVAERAESSETGTNVQEQNVDELDVVKTNGEQLYRVEDGTLTTDDVTGAEVRRESTLDLGDLKDGELFLAGDTVTVIGNDGTRAESSLYGYTPAPPNTRVLSVDVSDPVKPEITATMDFDSSLITARLHGDTVRLITAAGLPELDFAQPGSGKQRLTEKAALEKNQELVRRTTISDWLPTGSVDGGTDKRLAECEDVAVPQDDLGLDTMSVVGFDAAEPTTWDVTALAANAPLAYASEDHLYLGASPTAWGGCFDFCPLAATTTSDNDEAGTTHVFDFDLTTTGTAYVGAGEVDGMVQDRWSMDEHDGTLHLAVSPTERTGNFNSIVNLQREGDALVEVGRLDQLGANETIQSVRWMGPLAILVTFRQIDPLYTIDLTDPEQPTLLGELKIPGFSDYLHPLGPNRLLGMGEGPSGKGGWGAAAGLFKVKDLTDPRRKDLVTYANGTQALAGTDPRQFTWLPSERVALTVIAKGAYGRTGWVSVLSLKNGEMTNRMVEAEYGVEIEDLRLVPLPDGRVVMSTGDGAEFFDVAGG